MARVHVLHVHLVVQFICCRKKHMRAFFIVHQWSCFCIISLAHAQVMFSVYNFLVYILECVSKMGCMQVCKYVYYVYVSMFTISSHLCAALHIFLWHKLAIRSERTISYLIFVYYIFRFMMNSRNRSLIQFDYLYGINLNRKLE